MKRLCKKFRVGETVRTQDPGMPGIYTIIGQDGSTYTLWDGQQEYPKISRTLLMPSGYFKNGDKVYYDGNPGVVYTVQGIIGDGIYYIESDDDAQTGVRYERLTLVS